MYLRTVTVENVGPIAELNIEMPFDNGLPRPLVLVGPNGSGKSTLLSFVVNALVGFKQQVFEEAEIEQSRVYRIRSGGFIRSGSNWYHVKLDFDGGLGLDEWVLDRPKQRFETEVVRLPIDTGWQKLGDNDTESFSMTPQPQHAQFRSVPPALEKQFQENVVLFFPSDRFEPPNWLNEQSLALELRFPEPPAFKGRTSRRIFSRALPKPTLEWLRAVVFDSRLLDFVPHPVRLSPGDAGIIVTGLIPSGGWATKLVTFVRDVLARVLAADPDSVRLIFGDRNTGTISVAVRRAGVEEIIPNLLGLSAGEAALFCLFSNIIRDCDLARAQLNELADIRGIVIIDEADLHLHVDLQYRVLPELLRLFPKIQFIVTAHSPLFVMGMQAVFGDSGFHVIDMRTGRQTNTEAFGEFGHALDAFVKTRAFDQRVLERIQNSAKPVVLVEGGTDASHLQTAWSKLNPINELPWDFVPCGGPDPEQKGRGGAVMLKMMLEACCLHPDRPVLGLFDHDREGMEQFGGLQAAGLTIQGDDAHRKHNQQPVHAVVLTVPQGREHFVSPKAKRCFLALEHFYSDTLLIRYGVADDPVVADSAVFAITTDATKKTRFADTVKTLSPADFENFKPLFERISQVLGTRANGIPSTLGSLLVSHIDCAPPSMPEGFAASQIFANPPEADGDEQPGRTETTESEQQDKHDRPTAS